MDGKSNLRLVDGFRGLAALGVYGYHSVQLTSATWWPASGYLAVDLFFLLSGIVIALAYDDRIASGTLSAPRFLLLRVIRFYPLYAAGAIAAAAVTIVAIQTRGHPVFNNVEEVAISLGATLLFLPNKVRDYPGLFPLIMPYWSLFFELVINAAFVLTWRWLSNRVLIAVIGCGALALILIAASGGSLEQGSGWPTMGTGLARVVFSFTIGVYFARNVRRGSRVSDTAFLLGSGLLMIVLALDPGAWRGLYDLACMMAVFPLLGLLALKVQPGVVGSRAAKMLGDSSYGVYTLHMPANGALLGGLGLLHVSREPFQPWLFMAAAVSLVAFVLFFDRFIDRPVRRWLTWVTAPGADTGRSAV